MDERRAASTFKSSIELRQKGYPTGEARFAVNVWTTAESKWTRTEENVTDVAIIDAESACWGREREKTMSVFTTTA